MAGGKAFPQNRLPPLLCHQPQLAVPYLIQLHHYPAANLPQDEQYAFMDLMSNHNVEAVVMGHFHAREQRQFGGVQYLMTDNLNEGEITPSYLVLTVGDKVGYEYQELEME